MSARADASEFTSDHQHVSLLLGRLQVAHVPDVQQVEQAVGERDGAARLPRRGDAVEEAHPRDDLLGGPGSEALLHISEMRHGRTERTEDVVKKGDRVTVKLIDRDERGRLRLSMKALQPKPEASAGSSDGEPAVEGEPGGQAAGAESEGGEPRERSGDRGGDRGGRPRRGGGGGRGGRGGRE